MRNEKLAMSNEGQGQSNKLEFGGYPATPLFVILNEVNNLVL